MFDRHVVDVRYLLIILIAWVLLAILTLPGCASAPRRVAAPVVCPPLALGTETADWEARRLAVDTYAPPPNAEPGLGPRLWDLSLRLLFPRFMTLVDLY